MRILITGGAGFIGSNLALHLRRTSPEAIIVCMDNLHRRGSELNVPRLQEAGVRFHRGDVSDGNSFPSGPFDFIVECSAEPSVLAGKNDSPDYVFQTNLVGAYQCLEKARSWDSKFLFLSTSRVYPIARLEAHPWHEEETRFVWEDHSTSDISSQGVTEQMALTGARSLYGFTKLAAEQLIEEYRAAYAMKAAVNRCSVIAGPWQFGKVDQGVAALWVLAHHFGYPLSYIGYGGRGKQLRDVLHVDDLCDLICEQINDFDRWDGWLGNVSGGLSNSVSLCELTALCRKITGNKIPISSVMANRPNDVRILVADCSRLFERTTWRPKRDLYCIIEDINNWVHRHADALKHLSPVRT
ncbi:MAG TPA: NAD-dependent epimerase/dehydratase family protein [Candidatus Udaeobacter sp.]|jgi:CDP-paratose 2-epimerase|nr:NAD-dependent epimerase/dehydratase family protein [Candidatus Udaeobacter sp.]